MWRGSTDVKRCGVALTSATTPAPVQNLSPSWVVSLSVASSFHTTSVGGTVSRLYMCKSVSESDRGGRGKGRILFASENVCVLVYITCSLSSVVESSLMRMQRVYSDTSRRIIHLQQQLDEHQLHWSSDDEVM